MHSIRYCGFKANNSYYIPRIHYDEWLNLTYEFTACSLQISKVVLYTPGNDRQLTDGDDPIHISISRDNFFYDARELDHLPTESECNNSSETLANVNIDLKITRNVHAVLNGVITAKGQRRRNSSCSCVSVPSVRYSIINDLPGKMHEKFIVTVSLSRCPWLHSVTIVERPDWTNNIDKPAVNTSVQPSNNGKLPILDIGLC